jgi:hypothetical protein
MISIMPFFSIKESGGMLHGISVTSVKMRKHQKKCFYCLGGLWSISAIHGDSSSLMACNYFEAIAKMPHLAAVMVNCRYNNINH